MQIVSTGMEVSSEIIAETVRHGLKRKEVPVKAIYSHYSLSKGQSFTVGLQTLVKLLLSKAQRSMR
jgi:predicted nucleotidyltransferase